MKQQRTANWVYLAVGPRERGKKADKWQTQQRKSEDEDDELSEGGENRRP